MKKYIASLFIISQVSCNPVGEDLTEIQLIPNEITSAKGLDLKKGDEVVFWVKNSVPSESLVDYNVKYSVALDNKIVCYDSTFVQYGDHTINSKVSESDGIISQFFSNENGSAIEFERENKSFKVPEDGKYDFDFKLYNPEDDSFFSKNFSIIIRGKK